MVTRTKNTGSYCREYTVKTVLRIGDYVTRKSVKAFAQIQVFINVKISLDF